MIIVAMMVIVICAACSALAAFNTKRQLAQLDDSVREQYAKICLIEKSLSDISRQSPNEDAQKLEELEKLFAYNGNFEGEK